MPITSIISEVNVGLFRNTEVSLNTIWLLRELSSVARSVSSKCSYSAQLLGQDCVAHCMYGSAISMAVQT